MTKGLSLFSFKSSGLVLALAGVIVPMVLFMAPRAQTSTTKAENCSNAPDHATLNFYPIQYGNTAGYNCTDFPAVDGRLVNGGHYSASAQEWNQGVSANVGDEVYILLYIHNGARQNGDPNLTTARNVRILASVDSAVGSTHVVNAVFQGDNTNTVNSSFKVNTPANAYLQVEPNSGEVYDYQQNLVQGGLNVANTTYNLGDMQACFEHLRFVRFKVKVVAQQVAPAPSGHISVGNLQGNNSPCVFSATVSWTLQNVTSAIVTMVDPSGHESDLATSGASGGTKQIGNLQPNQTYTFKLYNTDSGSRVLLDSVSQATGNLNCQQPVVPSGQIVLGGVNENASNCTFTATFNWSTQNVANVIITQSKDNGAEQTIVSGSQPNGSKTVDSLQLGHSYIFTLYANDNGQVRLGATAPAMITDNSCGQQQVPTGALGWGAFQPICPAGTFNALITWSVQNANSIVITQKLGTGAETDVVSRTGSSGNETITGLQANSTYVISLYAVTNGARVFLNKLNVTTPAANCQQSSFTLTVNQNTFCVGQQPTYTITGTSDLIGSTIGWTSNFNGQNTSGGNVGQLYAQNGQAYWTGIGNAWTSNDIGTWIKTATINGMSQSVTLTVSNTGTCAVITPPPVVPLLVCNGGGSVYMNQNAVFYASGGGANYIWNSPVASPNSGNGSSFNTSFPTAGNYSVTVNSGSQTASCPITVISTVTNTGNINNSGNFNNNNQVTGNNNNVCVNNSCNYYINTSGNTVPANNYAQLSIAKVVRDVTAGGSFANSVNANAGDTVEFQITVSNIGNQPINNVRVTDNLGGGFNYLYGTTRTGGGYNYGGDSLVSGGLSLGSLSAGDQRQILFQATVSSSQGGSLQNIAQASGDNVPTVQDDAWVFVSNVAGSNVNLSFSKKAFNNTKNVDATSVSAARQDEITYTLTVANNGNSPANNFVITDDLSGVLPYADIVDNGGGTLNGNVITFPAITVPANGSVSKSFRVRIKYFLVENLRYVMTNTYGNTVTVNIGTPQVLGAFIAPKTGSDSNALWFASFLTFGFLVFKKRAWFKRLLMI